MQQVEVAPEREIVWQQGPYVAPDATESEFIAGGAGICAPMSLFIGPIRETLINSLFW